MRFWNLFVALFVLLCPAMASADEALVINRVDANRGAGPSFTNGIVLFDSGLEFWSLGNGTDLEVGKLWPIYQHKQVSLLAGGYVVYWPESEDYFLLPWLHGEASTGRLCLAADVAGYLPLTGGPSILFSNEVSLTYQPRKGLRLGLATAFWDQEGYDVTARLGPTVKLNLGSRDRVEIRYLFGENGNNNLRVQWNHRF